MELWGDAGRTWELWEGVTQSGLTHFDLLPSCLNLPAAQQLGLCSRFPTAASALPLRCAAAGRQQRGRAVCWSKTLSVNAFSPLPPAIYGLFSGYLVPR